jgi:replication fork protection complex subunit Csm3/Swi3
LLSFYQLWLDDLFPKAKFLDALAMVEKAGHKKMLQIKRNEWINESKPKDKDNADYIDDSFHAPNTNAAVAEMPGTGETSAQDRPKTPEPGQDDVPDDDDLYDATPRTTRRTVPITTTNNDEPDADDLDALMAEAETHDTGNLNKKPHTRPEHDEDELDALIAEAEGHDERPQSCATAAKGNAGQRDDRDFADEEAAMQEMDGLW